MTRKKGKGSRWRCISPPKAHNESEKPSKRKRGRAPGNALLEHQHNGRAVCTWLPTNKLPVDVLAVLEDDIASARRMMNLKITQRRLAVPANSHAITYKASKKYVGPVVTAYFSKVSESTKNEKLRLCSSDFSDDDYECDPPISKSDSPIAKKQRSGDQCGLRICPYSGFAHDYQWFVNEYGLDPRTFTLMGMIVCIKLKPGEHKVVRIRIKMTVTRLTLISVLWYAESQLSKK